MHHKQEVEAISESGIIFFVLLIASLFDLSCYRVPNAFLASALCISLFRHLQLQGVCGVCPWLLGMIIPFMICYVLYRCRMLGASDIKLFSVIGSFVGLRLLCSIMVTSLFFGAAMAAVKMICRKNIFCRSRQLSNYVVCIMQTGKLKPYYDRKKEGEDGIIPFTVAISLAALYCLF